MRTRYSPPPHLLLSVTFLPDDFPTRLGLFKEATGLSWNGLATCMGVDPRQIQRWRRGTKPNGDGLFALFLLAARIPGGIYLLLRSDVKPPEWTPRSSGNVRAPSTRLANSFRKGSPSSRRQVVRHGLSLQSK